MGAREIAYDPENDYSTPQVSYNEEGHKVVKYQSNGYNITATVLNQPSEEAIKAANKQYNELFYKFNPQVAPI